MSIVDDLLANTGLYIGVNRAMDHEGVAAARMVIAPLPGGAGVSFDYETFDPTKGDRIQAHREHTVVAKMHTGGNVCIVSHVHADSVAILRESEPGVFELGAEGSPFPMKIVMSMPSPGHFLHSWWYGRPGEDVIERDAAELTLS
jgi:hypothetical protein